MSVTDAESQTTTFAYDSLNRLVTTTNALGDQTLVSYGAVGNRTETTDAKGRYFFRTIKPVSYPGRTPHIHVIIKKGRHHLLTTQLYIKGERRNLRDGVYRRIRTVEQRKLVTIPFVPVQNSKIGELTARADIIVGMTPKDPAPGRRR